LVHGLAVTPSFRERNGFEPSPAVIDDDVADTILEAADGRIDGPELALWLRERLVRIVLKEHE
jgi:hypothetical protein